MENSKAEKMDVEFKSSDRKIKDTFPFLSILSALAYIFQGSNMRYIIYIIYIYIYGKHQKEYWKNAEFDLISNPLK